MLYNFPETMTKQQFLFDMTLSLYLSDMSSVGSAPFFSLSAPVRFYISSIFSASFKERVPFMVKGVGGLSGLQKGAMWGQFRKMGILRRCCPAPSLLLSPRCCVYGLESVRSYYALIFMAIFVWGKWKRGSFCDLE